MGYIQTIVLALAVLLGAAGGYYFEHTQVLVMEGRIKDQKIEAAKVLAEEVLKVSLAEEAQRTLNLELDKSHEAFIKTSNAYSVEQSNLIDRLQFTDGRKSSSSSTSEGTTPSLNPTDAEEFTWVSKKLLKYLAGESVRAEQDGFDKNELIVFVIDQNCGVPR
jgi:hypothetical protein